MLSLLLASLSFGSAFAQAEQVSGQFSITFGGTISGSNYTDVTGTFSDPGVTGYEATDVTVGDFLAEKRNDGTLWCWKIIAINSADAVNLDIDVEPAGSHTGRPVANLQTGDAAITDGLADALAYIPPFSFHGINSNLLSVFHNLNDPHPLNAGDTNIAVANLTADDHRTHAFAGFNQTWNNLGTIAINANTLANMKSQSGNDFGYVAVTPTYGTLEFADAGGSNLVLVDNAGIGLAFATGNPLIIQGDAGTAGQALTSNGPSSPPSWQQADTHVLNANLSSAADQSWLHDANNSEIGWQEVKNWYMNFSNTALPASSFYFGIDPTSSAWLFKQNTATPGSIQQLIIEDANVILQNKSNGGDATGAIGTFEIGTGNNIQMSWYNNGVAGNKARIVIKDADTVNSRPQIHLHTDAIDQGTAAVGQVLTLLATNDGEAEWAAAVDANAIHDNVAAEISALSLVTVASGDHILIEDSDDANNKKRIVASDLQTDPAAIHDNVANEISALTEKATPVSADLLIIEDSAAAGVKKKIQIGNLPSSGGGGGTSAVSTATTTDATPTALYTFATAADTSYQVTAEFSARRTTDSAAVAGYSVIATYRNDGGALTLVSSATTAHSVEDDGTWGGGTLIASGTDIVAQVTGLAATTIDWSVNMMILDDAGNVIGNAGSPPAQALTTQVSSADANVAATLGVSDIITMAGFTADRIYTLPSSSSIGNRYGVGTPDGNATYEILIKTGAVGSLIDGVDYSTNEFTRLFIAGEKMDFVCVDGSGPKFICEVDGRKPCIVDAYLSTNSASETVSTWVAPTSFSGVWTEITDNGGIFTAGTSIFTPRRNGNYAIHLGAQNASGINDTGLFGLQMTNGTTIARAIQRSSVASAVMAMSVTRVLATTAGTNWTYQYQSSTGTAGLQSTDRVTYCSIAEQL